jgi:hypothetical protein
MGKSLRWLGCAQSLSIYLGARFGLRRTARRSIFSFSPPVICAVCSCNMRLSASFWPTFITTPPPPWELAVLHFHSVRTQFSFQAVLYCPSSIRRTSGQVSRLIPFLIINIVSAHLPHCAHSYLCVDSLDFTVLLPPHSMCSTITLLTPLGTRSYLLLYTILATPPLLLRFRCILSFVCPLIPPSSLIC